MKNIYLKYGFNDNKIISVNDETFKEINRTTNLTVGYMVKNNYYDGVIIIGKNKNAIENAINEAFKKYEKVVFKMDRLEKRVKDIAYNAVAVDKLIGKTIENVTTENDVQTYEFKGYKFQVERREFLDVNGNPIYLIKPVGWINELPKIDGFRRSFKNWNYSTQSYNIESDMYMFFLRLNVLINKAENDESIFNK